MISDSSAISEARASYLAKENYLQTCYTQVAPLEFYRDLFVEDSLQKVNVSADGRGCAIFRFRPDKSTYKRMSARIRGDYIDELWRESSIIGSSNYFSKLFNGLDAVDEAEIAKRQDALDKIFGAGQYFKPGKPIEVDWKFDQCVHDDLSELGEAMGKRLAFIAPISYFGKKANSTNARYLHSITLDLDGVGMKQLKMVIAAIQNKLIPVPTYLVNSGHGLHLYYFLEEPVPLYRYVRKYISRLKNALINEIWNDKTSTKKHKDDQPWCQMYRVVGSLSKLGVGYPATAYKVGDYTSLETLNDYLLEEDRILLPLDKYCPKGKSGHNLEYWRIENPDWYNRRILKQYDNRQSPSKGKFPHLYESFKPRVRRFSRVGNRYNCMCVLFADAAICGIPYSEVYKYACDQLEIMNLGVDESELFTQEDIDCATKYYNPNFGQFMTLERIEKLTGIKLPPNKRNHRSQEEHIKYLNGMKSIGLFKDTRFGASDGNDNTKGGRPKGSGTAEQSIRDYLLEYPDAKKCEIIKDLGLTKPTVYKWYKIIKEETKTNEQDN